ncbi:MAG: 2-succinyl-5-enolpyruvyl-6-hydroxy-3-cyclohexene-1-carboxylic-acid synthase [candidate division Zixibacteria bacterium]|nr:2-succinyl-5-enolpyruvyl-6-hydroxy-3-cyclohexene-1-carboxylic-acid synthase [candidate division Zixibacteria bacterium]
MNENYTNINSVWAALLVEELVRCGVSCFFISPGSRNTPLTAAVALNKRASSLVHFDERGAAYAALGYSKATGEPAALICTSGTATANYFPAIIDASQEHIPLIVLTADRPPELRHTNANQTIQQVGLFGIYVRWFCDMPCPNDVMEPTYPLATVDQAVCRAKGSPVGPVHINCMFREPLAPIGDDQDFTEYLAPLSDWLQSDQPHTRCRILKPEPIAADLEPIAKWINKIERGVIIVGSLRDEADRRAAFTLSRQLGWPLLPDITSAGSANDDFNGLVVSYYDMILASQSWTNQHQPKAVIHLGGRTISKRLAQWLKASRPQHYLTVTDHPFRQDADRLTTNHFDCGVVAFSQAIGPCLKNSGAATRGDATRGDTTEWATSFVEASSKVDYLIAGQFHGDDLAEPAVARLISKHIHPEACLFLGNSMPIRDMDSFADPTGPAVAVGCNRGASGIDGSIATAVGFGLGMNKPVTLLLGDLALLHDMNSLALLRQLEHSMTVIVINNNGGGIFSFLPIAERNDIFESFWGTPHNMDFKHAARQFDLAYKCPSTLPEFEEIYRASQTKGASVLIEIRTDREANARLHEKLIRAVTAELNRG